MYVPSGIRVLGTGSSLPGRVLRNDDFPPSLDTSDEWIRTRTGIVERRICAPGETTASLGVAAARRALDAAGLAPHDLDLIVCATVTPDTVVPATACLIQAELGCRRIPAFDLNAACSGFLYALATASQFLQTGSARHTLVVGSETLSRVVDFSDRSTCVLFGDGAGAVVLSAVDGPARGPHSFRLYADGSRRDLIRITGVANRRPLSSAPYVPAPGEDPFLRMNGREVFRFAVRTICELTQEAMADCGLTIGDLALIIPHQVNQRIIDAAFAELGIPASKLMVNLDRYGNTSAASVPIALDEAFQTRRLQPEDCVLLMAFGGGLTWASAVLTV
jgi:3-oxoacyl-[acyl-carrier-protein] synthase III